MPSPAHCSIRPPYGRMLKCASFTGNLTENDLVTGALIPHLLQKSVKLKWFFILFASPRPITYYHMPNCVYGDRGRGCLFVVEILSANVCMATLLKHSVMLDLTLEPHFTGSMILPAMFQPCLPQRTCANHANGYDS